MYDVWSMMYGARCMMYDLWRTKVMLIVTLTMYGGDAGDDCNNGDNGDVWLCMVIIDSVWWCTMYDVWCAMYDVRCKKSDA